MNLAALFFPSFLQIQFNMKSARQKEARRRMKMSRGKWVMATTEEIKQSPSWMSRAYKNNRFVVMINDSAKTDKGTAICAMIQAHDNKPIPNHWAELQRIKNELLGVDCTAVEYYPSSSNLIDDHNIYWIWVFPQGSLPVPVLF